MNSNARAFHTLDALRGIAAIGVVIFHFGSYFEPLRSYGGYLAVDLFFAMSGAVIAYAYDRRFASGMTKAQFLRIRLIRLYPLYALGTVLGVIIAISSFHGNNLAGWSAGSIALSSGLAAFMLPNVVGYPNARLFPLDTPCWSLLFEVLVNIGFAFAWSWLKGRALLLVCVISGCVLLAWTEYLGSADQGYVLATIVPGIVRALYGFCLGVLLARHVGHAPRTDSGPLFLVICAVVAASIVVGASHRALWDPIFIFVLFPVVIYASLRIDPPKTLVAPAAFFGLTSYAVYVLHEPVLTGAGVIIRHLPHSAHAAPYLGFGLVCGLLVIAWLVDRFYDLPVRRALARRFSRA